MIDNLENHSELNLEANSNLIFIDAQIPNYQGLIPNIKQAEVVILEPDLNGIEQITATLAQRQEISSLHIISHGDVGYLQLGNSHLNLHNLVNYTDQLEQWSEFLSEDADILLYGCEVAAEDRGVEFIEQLSNLTSADVAASNDLTGNILLGGDWQLETATGEIESTLPLEPAIIEDYNHVFAVAEDDLVMELKLDETSGIQAADTSTAGQDNFGTLVNGAFFESVGGDLGGGVTLDGDDDYIQVLNSDDINLQNYAQRSISIWFNADDVNIDSKKQVIYEEGGDGRGLNIYLDNGQLYVGGWNRGESNWTSSFLSTAEVSSDTWHHVALVLDAIPDATSVQPGAFSAYLDGAKFGSGVGSQVWAHPNGIAIGGIQGYTRFHDGVASGIGTQTLAGTVADVQLYNAALNADEINTLASLATPNAGAISLSTDKFQVNETDGSIEIDFVRTGGSDGTVTVDYRTFDDSAIAGEDYEEVVGTFTFAPGETSKSVSIPILADSVIEDIEQFSFTIDNVLGATLLAPTTAVIDIVDSEGSTPPNFSFSDFSDISNLTLNGSATQSNNKLRLTPPESNLAGSAFYNQLIGIEADTSFQTNFQFQISEGDNSDGANGLTFIMHNVESGVNALGFKGAGIGYADIGTESIAVEFDTYQDFLEVNNNHVSLLQNGDATTALSTATPNLDLNSGAVLNAWVDYDGVSDLLSVFLSDTTEKPATALLTETIDLQLSLGEQAFVGFTAGTGGLNNAHEIISWDFMTNTNPNAGAISLSTNKFKVNETDGTVEINVVRTGGSDGTATVDYRTFDNSAIAGEDYQGVAGTFTFAPGETSKSVAIPILEDSVIEDIEQFSFTVDNATGATLLAPRTAVIDIIDSEGSTPPTFSFSDFSDTSTLTLNGSATQSNNKLRLTPPESNLAGSAFYNQLIGIEADTSFQTNFQFQLSEGDNSDGANGLTFMMHNVESGVNALGSPGAGLGYTGTGTESIAVEFDTYQDFLEVNNNHVSLLQNGDATQALSTATPNLDLNSGAVLNAWVDYDGVSDLLSVFLSDTTEKPATALLTETIDLQLSLGEQAFVGFTAGTGGLNNAHEIISWDFTTTGEVLDSPVIPPGNEIEETVISGLLRPTAIEWTADGDKLFIAEKRGTVRLFENGQLQTALIVDITAQVNSNTDRGLIDIAVHPDLENHPYLYLYYTYEPPEVFNYPNDETAGPDGDGNRTSRLTRVTLDASTNYTSIVPDSEVILLGANGTWDNFNGFVNSTVNFDEPPAGILPDGSNLQDFLAADSQSHSAGSVEFGLDGALYVSNGDGTSYNQMDSRTVRVQDLNNLSGKVLRIDPITGKGLADNPFYDGDPDSNISKVYQSGLRNPFRMRIHPSTGEVLVGDVGWRLWEEINSGGAGANFGWPFFEGGNGENLRAPQYQDLPEAEAFYASGTEVTPSIFALNHSSSGINAIVMGDIYTGSTYPAEYQGDLFFNDLGQGIVRNISFDASGNISSIEVFSTEAQIVVQIAQGPDGNLYYVDLDDGLVGRWNFA